MNLPVIRKFVVGVSVEAPHGGRVLLFLEGDSKHDIEIGADTMDEVLKWVSMLSSGSKRYWDKASRSIVVESDG